MTNHECKKIQNYSNTLLFHLTKLSTLFLPKLLGRTSQTKAKNGNQLLNHKTIHEKIKMQYFRNNIISNKSAIKINQ